MEMEQQQTTSEVAPGSDAPQMEMEMETEAETKVEEKELPEGDDTLFDFQPDDDSSDDDNNNDSDEDDSLLHDDSTLLGTSGEEASELTLETREERAYAESIARAQRKMRQDDYATVNPGIGAGWPKKSLLEASTASSSSGSSAGKQTHRPAVGSSATTEQSAAALKTARANAVSRRDLTVRKLHQARRSKRMQQKQLEQQQAQDQQDMSTPRTPRKTLKLGLSAAAGPAAPGTPGTPNTLNTTMSSLGSPLSLSAGRMTPTRSLRSSTGSRPSSPSSPSAGLPRSPASPLPPPTARAYNRFFPPKMVETHDVEGTDSAVCVEPDAETGEVELHIEEKVFMTDPVAASDAAATGTTVQELFGASKWDQIAEMAKKKLEERGSGGGYADQEEEYFHSVVSDDRSVFSQKSLPSVLGNESIFHDTAVQAVASLLSLPNYASPRRSSYEAATAAIPEGVSVDADEETSSAISGLSGFSTYSAANNTRGMFEATLQATPEMGEDEMSVQSFITGHLEDFVQSIPDQMITPTSQQLDVIAAIHTNGSEEETPMTTAATRGLMTRRMNACGSLKLLASRSANRTQLAWTGGILAALTSVLADSPFNYVDKATYNAYMVARERSVSALVCLSAEKDNRILLLHSPGLVHSLIKTIDEDDRECRLGCCVVLKNLSLAIENRRLMAQIPGLIDALLEVITGGNKDLITAELYDSSPNENLHAARANAFAVFMNLTKERENAHRLVRNKELVEVLVSVSKLQKSPSHARALAVLVHFTRFRDSTKSLVFDNRLLISTIANGASSPNVIAQRSAVRSIQNISASRSCRPHILPNTYGLVESLCKIAQGKLCTNRTEIGCSVRHSAVGALKNLADEPSNLMPMLKVTDCLPTLIHVSHGTTAEGVSPAMALMAKDALANFSEFYMRIVTEAARKKEGIEDPDEDPAAVCGPSARTIMYSQWE